MALVDARSFQLTPDITGSVSRGLQSVGQLQQLQGVAQERDITAQSQQLTGVILDPQSTPEMKLQAQQQLTAINPQAVQNLQTIRQGERKGFSERETAQLKSISQAAAQAVTLPDDKAKLDFFNRRKAELARNNIPTEETQDFIDLYEAGRVEEANVMLEKTVGLGRQLGFIEQMKGGVAAKSVQSSKQLPGGLVQIVFKDGLVKTVEPSEADKLLVISAEERGALLQGMRAGERDAAKQAIKISGQAFDSVGKIEGNITNLEEVIRLVGEGAETGPLAAKMPSFRAASVALDTMRNRLGLDVIGAVTFGALSKGELDLALDTALPTKLEGPKLIQWANNKIDAQRKLANYYREQALFLGSGNKLADFIEQKRAQPVAQALPQGVTEEDIAETMRVNNVTRQQVLDRIGAQ